MDRTIQERIWNHVCGYTLLCFCVKFDYFDTKVTREFLESEQLRDRAEIVTAIHDSGGSVISHDDLKRFMEFPMRFEQLYFAPMTQLLRFFNDPRSNHLDNGWLWWTNIPAMHTPFCEQIESFLKSVLGAAERRTVMNGRLQVHLDFCLNWYDKHADAYQPVRDRMAEMLANYRCARWLFIEGLDPKFFEPSGDKVQCPIKPARVRECLEIIIHEYEIQLTALDRKIEPEESLEGTNTMKAVEEDLNIVCEFLTHGLSPFIRQHDQTEISHDHQWMPFYEQHSLGEIAKITSISKTDLSRRQGEYVRTSDGWFPVIKVWRNDTLVLKYWLDKELLPVKMTQQSEQPLLLPQPGHIQAVPKLFPPVGGE